MCLVNLRTLLSTLGLGIALVFSAVLRLQCLAGAIAIAILNDVVLAMTLVSALALAIALAIGFARVVLGNNLASLTGATHLRLERHH